VSRAPYWRLSSFYLFYFACVGAWIPYWPLYVQHLGHGALAIGLTGAVFSAARIIAPGIWGYLSDASGRRLQVIRHGCFCAFVAILGLIWARDIWLITLVLLPFSFFWSAVGPQFEVLTMHYLGHRAANHYGRVRLWGSVGFILAVLCGWLLFEWVSIARFPWLIAVLLLLLWGSSLAVPSRAASRAQGADAQGRAGHRIKQSFRASLMRRHVWVYLLAVVLMQISFGPYYNFFSILLADFGYPLMAVSLFWLVAIGAEIFVFIYVSRFYRWLGVGNLLLLSMVLTVLRWMITGAFPDHIALLIFAQALHAFSFATFHACMIEQIQRLFPPAQQGRGQALFNSAGYGVGAVAGALLSGLLWEPLGAALFYLAALVAAVALLMGWLALRHRDFAGS